jgi:hypothetical protein
MAKNRGPGRPRKLADHVLFSLRLRSDLHTDLRKYALDEKRSLNDILGEIVEKWWDKRRRDGRPSGRKPLG